MLTLAGCGLHPYPPLLSLPGARQRRRQASEMEKMRGKRERRREKEGVGGAEILRSVISERPLFSLPLYISILHFMSWPRYNSFSNMYVV